MQKQKASSNESLEKAAITTTNAFGTVWSIIIHTILFLGAFILIVTGANLNRVLLVLTTLVSLEAIYLAIFIKMSSNQQTKTLEKVENAMEEIVEDVEEIRQDVNAIEKEVDGIQVDMDKNLDGEPVKTK
jgi:peptidoglycan hydrolase CwlO-like protein